MLQFSGSCTLLCNIQDERNIRYFKGIERHRAEIWELTAFCLHLGLFAYISFVMNSSLLFVRTGKFSCNSVYIGLTSCLYIAFIYEIIS